MKIFPYKYEEKGLVCHKIIQCILLSYLPTLTITFGLTYSSSIQLNFKREPGIGECALSWPPQDNLRSSSQSHSVTFLWAISNSLTRYPPFVSLPIGRNESEILGPWPLLKINLLLKLEAAWWRGRSFGVSPDESFSTVEDHIAPAQGRNGDELPIISERTCFLLATLWLSNFSQIFPCLLDIPR
jgi:hypothetical protein